MRRAAAELAATAAVMLLVCVDTPDLWRMLARGCQSTAEAVGRIGIYAEAHAAVLMSEAA